MSPTNLVLQYFSFVTGFVMVCWLRRLDPIQILGSIAAGTVGGLLVLMPGKHEVSYSAEAHLAFYAIAALTIMAGAAWATAREKLSLRMSEGSIYLLTLTFVYILSPWQLVHKIVAGATAPPCVFVCVACFFTLHLSPRVRIALSIWAMLASIAICIQNIAAAPGSLLLPNWTEPDGWTALTYWLQTALVSATFVFLVFNCIPIINMLRGKHESPEAYQRRMNQDVYPYLENRILGSEIPFKVTLFVTLAHGLPLLLNAFYHFVPFQIAVAYALMVSPLLTFALADRLFPCPATSKPTRPRRSK